MSDLTVSIVIPLFGPEHYFTACLESLARNTTDYSLIVVDNGTGYDCSGAFHLDALVRNAENKGFAEAINQGVKCSKADIVVLLNVDTEVQFDWLAELMTAFDDPEVVMAGPRIIHPAGDLQTSGVRTWHGVGSAGGEEIKEDLPTRDVDGVTGACMAVRRDVFNDVGQLDTNFKNGYEDVSLCLSVREAGHRIRYIRESLVIHHESVAGGPERWAYAHENVAYMNQLWGNR